MIRFFLEGLKAQGWTQKAIAEKIGVQPNMISKFMNGKTCTIETLIKFAKSFDVSTDKVLGLDRQEPEKPKANSMSQNLKTGRNKGERQRPL